MNQNNYFSNNKTKRAMKKALIYTLLVVVLALGYILEWRTAQLKFSPNKAEPVTYQELTSWQILEFAISNTESSCNQWAIGRSNDVGIMQLTPIYVEEVNRICDSLEFCHNDAFSIEKTLQMFNIYQDAKNPKHDIEKAIRLHNPNGDSINYTERVMQNYRLILTLEDVRKQIYLYGSPK